MKCPSCGAACGGWTVLRELWCSVRDAGVLAAADISHRLELAFVISAEPRWALRRPLPKLREIR